MFPVVHLTVCHLMYIISLSIALRGRGYYSHFIGEEIEAEGS